MPAKPVPQAEEPRYRNISPLRNRKDRRCNNSDRLLSSIRRRERGQNERPPQQQPRQENPHPEQHPR